MKYRKDDDCIITISFTNNSFYFWYLPAAYIIGLCRNVFTIGTNTNFLYQEKDKNNANIAGENYLNAVLLLKTKVTKCNENDV